VAFEGSNYGLNTALKIYGVLDHIIACDNHSIPSFMMRRMLAPIRHVFKKNQ
jgi:hypothetical protein